MSTTREALLQILRTQASPIHIDRLSVLLARSGTLGMGVEPSDVIDAALVAGKIQIDGCERVSLGRGVTADPLPVPIRYIKSQGVRYLRESDVYAFLETLAGSEPTDVRNRIYEAVRNMKQASGK